ncbi:hypothetical protein FB480_101924 [Agrobacterium vitis]|nr:hypothetical protein FB480_101924 [Agrobacterium vitis]
MTGLHILQDFHVWVVSVYSAVHHRWCTKDAVKLLIYCIIPHIDSGVRNYAVGGKLGAQGCRISGLDLNMTAIVSGAAYRRICAKMCANVLVMAAVVTVAGCAASNTTSVKPSTMTAPKSVVVTGQAEPADNYKTPDGYPDLSRPLTAANKQMSNDDAKKQEDRLSSLAAKRKKGLISETEYNKRVEEFRKLGQMQ